MPIILAIMVVFSTICIPSTQVMAETTSDGFSYTKYSDHVEITEYGRIATDIKIPSKIDGVNVTSIGGNAFYKCTLLI